MREVDLRLSLTLEHLDASVHLDDISTQTEDLEKSRSACGHSGELEELQDLLHFPEEVALRLADTEYQLFYQVPPIDYLRQVTIDLGGVGVPPPHSETPQQSSTSGSSVRSTVANLIKRFNEVSAWVTQLIISQPTHDERRAVLSCILRVALSSWNIGNFNGAMEIIAGLKSTKLRPFWLSITEKETLPILDFLSAALLSAEYDRALSRALDMAECRVVPFFGAFLRELREILASTPSLIMLEARTSSKQAFNSTVEPGSQTSSSQAQTGLTTATEHQSRSTSPCPPLVQQHSFGSTIYDIQQSGSNRSSRDSSAESNVPASGTSGSNRHHRHHHQHHHHHHSSPAHHTSGAPATGTYSPKHTSREQRCNTHRQVFISDYDGEDHYFTRIGPGGLINLEKIYRTQAVMDHISMFHQHFHNRNRCSPNNNNFVDYLKSISIAGGRVVQAAPSEKEELDEEYETEVDTYHPVQPLTNDHGVSFVSITSPLTGIDQHILQILHHGTTVVMLESDGNSSSSSGTGIGGGGDSGQTGRGAVLLYVRLDRAGVTLTWSRPSWSALRAGSLYYDNDASTASATSSSTFITDFNLSANPEETLSPGLLAKLSTQPGLEFNTSSSTLDEGYLDLMYVKELALGVRESEKEPEISVIARRFGILHGTEPFCLSLIYGHTLNDNRILYMLLPPVLCRLWYAGLGWLIRGIARQLRLSDRRILWLKEQYLQLYYEDACCCGPLAADAIRTFGGRDWSFAATVIPGIPASNLASSDTLKREASVKIKKKQLVASKRDSRTHLLDPVQTIGPSESYWRNPTQQHRQSTPARFSEPQPDVARHHSLGHLAYTAQPKFDRDRHGSMEQLWHGRHPRVGFILYETQLDFVDFVALFRSFSLLMRKDLRDLFDQLAISYRNMTNANNSPKVNGVKVSLELATSKKPQRIGLFTRNSPSELAGVTTTNSQRKIFDAIAAASIFSNCAGIDSSNSQVITLSTFTKFLETRQMENWSANDVKVLIQRHEPDPVLRSQDCLSFEGFARYLMDKDNFAFINERQIPKEQNMTKPMSHYYIASSHNTYLTGHQLKGESSVELYSQVLQSGCRCVELDCWDGDDGYPMIYHGHTFTTKIPFSAVVEAINRNAFVTSPYPVILSLENHCSLHQQTKMAQIFHKVFGEKLITNFLFDNDFSDDPVLPSPVQLKNRILIKNKKLNIDLQPTLTTPHQASISIAARSGAAMKHTGGRTSSIISNTSSSSFNDDFSDDEYDEDEEDENLDEKNLASILHSVPTVTTVPTSSTETSPRTCMGMSASHVMSKTSSTKRAVISDDKMKKRSSQIAKELSDIVVYIQAIKFRGLNTVSPNSSVKQHTRPPPPRTSSSGSSIMTVCSTSGSTSNISGGTVGGASSGVGVATDLGELSSLETEYTTTANIKTPQRANYNHPCYQCSSINENTAKKLCRKQPLALVTHTQTQLMRTYPAGMRIDSSNFNPVIFWAFGIQMAALNYQTEDPSLQLNTALFESNGKCGYVCKPEVMWDRTHVMYRRFNPWDKEFDGLHSSQLLINILSGQYICQSNINASTFVEIEIIGIPIDCNKQKTKVIQKNALNPIWNDTFYFRVMFHDLSFIRFNVYDSPTNHLIAQRVLPLKCLRPGYRHLRLRTPQNKPLNMSTLFIYSRTEEESLDSTGTSTTECMKDVNETEETKMTTPYTGISGTPLCVKRKMFFLMVYGVVNEEPYTILKTTQESTTQDVLLQCLQKAGLPAERVNDHILVEEVARGWEKKDHELPATQRILDLHERPLQAQSKWKGEGRFLLKRMGDDPSSRAWLSSIRSVANRERESICEKSSAWDEHDNFLVCIYNVSPEIPYAILKVPLGSTAQDVLAQALVKARRLEDPMNFVLVEELEWAGSGGHQQRALADDENVYSTQSHWQTIGRFILQERANATPTSLRRNRVTTNLRLATLDRISRGLSAARSAATSSIKAPVQAALSDPTTTKSKESRKISSGGISRSSKGNSEKEILAHQQRSQSLQCQREVHSEGETLSDEESKESDFLSTVSRLKKVSLRKFKEWKS